jgi:hypothetical protein
MRDLLSFAFSTLFPPLPPLLATFPGYCGLSRFFPFVEALPVGDEVGMKSGCGGVGGLYDGREGCRGGCVEEDEDADAPGLLL